MKLNTDVLILAGGLGTRLKIAIADKPKAMAIINGKPFLEYLLNYLRVQGISRVVLSVGYLKEQIIEYFGNHYNNVQIIYAIEEKPLGTGGAILNSMEKITSDYFFIFNGDTYFPINLFTMLEHYEKIKNLKGAIALKYIEKNTRYGSVEILGNKIISFKEKKSEHIKGSIINCGIYYFPKFLFKNYKKNVMSFEKEILPKIIKGYEILGFLDNSVEFIDIGIPSDYFKAQEMLKRLL